MVASYLFLMTTLTLGKKPSAPIRQEAGWTPEPVWMWRQWEASLPLVGIKPIHVTDWGIPAYERIEGVVV